MAWRLVLIERHQVLRKGIGKPLGAVLPQEHKHLGTTDAFHDSGFGRRQLDWGMPQEWTHGEALLLEWKEDHCLPCYHPIEKYSTDVLGGRTYHVPRVK
jgi:hypothetical protein